MPTTVVFDYDGEWESSADNFAVFKWRPRSSGKWAAISVDGDICSIEFLQNEIYRIIKLSRTKQLRLSYLPDLKHCYTRPMYIENDLDLKAYYYFGVQERGRCFMSKLTVLLFLRLILLKQLQLLILSELI